VGHLVSDTANAQLCTAQWSDGPVVEIYIKLDERRETRVHSPVVSQGTNTNKGDSLKEHTDRDEYERVLGRIHLP
jgi:hypothetical protein